MKIKNVPQNRHTRRHFLSRSLKGGSLAFTLPVLESLSANSHAACNSQRPRFISIYIPNGVVLDDWFSFHPGEGVDPADLFADWQNGGTLNPGSQNSTVHTGAQWAAAHSMQPIANAGLKNKIALYNHLSNQDLANGGYDGGEHPVGSTGFLNCSGQKNNEGTARSETSVDQIIADYYQQTAASPFHSMHLSSGIRHYFADGVEQLYSENIAWKSDGAPVTRYVSPKLAFERFIGAQPQGSEALLKKRSILDYVYNDAQSLTQKLAAADRERLDEYLTSVRELEQRIEQSENTMGACLANSAEFPHIVLGDIDYATYNRQQHMQLHYELMALAAKCQLTDVMTYVVDHERSEYDYGPGAGDHHGAQHGSSPGLRNIINILTTEFTGLLQSLDRIIDPNGKTALDNSVVMFGSGLMGRFWDQHGQDNTHQRKALPLVFAGSGGGVLRTNQHVALPFGTKLANCFNTLLNDVYCVPNAGFASSNGSIQEMLL